MRFAVRCFSAEALVDLAPTGVLMVTIAGAVTPGSLAYIKQEIAAKLRAEPAAIVADYRGAVLALSNADIRNMMCGCEVENLRALPAAVVSRADTAHAFRRHAGAAAFEGLARRVFPDPESAARWAYQEAQVHPAGQVARQSL